MDNDPGVDTLAKVCERTFACVHDGLCSVLLEGGGCVAGAGLGGVDSYDARH